MEPEKITRVSIITNDVVISSFYEAILKSKSYSLSKRVYSEEIFNLILDSVPHVIILHFDDQFYTKIFELLTKMHGAYNETERPLTLMVVPKDWFDESLDTIVDARLTFPVIPDQFLQTVENLVQKKSLSRQVGKDT